MTDLSMPPGDRPEPPAYRGPALARAALAGSSPPTDFVAQVAEFAREHGWDVHLMSPGDPSWPNFVAFRDNQIVIAHVGTPPSFVCQSWLARIGRSGIEAHTWATGYGMGPVEDVLGRPWPPIAPPGETDGGRRGD